MPKKFSNKQRKQIVGDSIKAERALIQASIDDCKAKRAENRKKSQELEEAQEKFRLQQLTNLRKKMVIIFAIINGEIVIFAIVDPSLMKSSTSVERNHHIIYGSPDYKEIHMMASYSPKGKRFKRIENYKYSYTVSTANGFKFHIIDENGTTRLSFETVIDYESLAGKSVSDVQFDQFWYDPFKGSIDDETAKFQKELDRLIRANADYVRKNPELLEKGYVPYRFGF